MTAENNIEKLKRLLGADHWSDEEKEWLLGYLENTQQEELRQLMSDRFYAAQAINETKADSDRLLAQIHNNLDVPNTGSRVFFLDNWKRMSAVAAILLMMGTGLFFFLNERSAKKLAQSSPVKAPVQKEIVPGSDNATLTLADGSTIVLDSFANGTLAEQGTVKVLKLNGQVSYDGTQSNEAPVLYNTISTSRGNQYRLVLADGSSIWLNAASSIRFPTAFNGTERKVEITGEVYLEVAKNPAMPFKVMANGVEIQVLGTHFNVNAYDDEGSVKTTLLEGKVKVSQEASTVQLDPSQQAVFNKQTQQLRVQAADIEEVIAWKEGMFEFHNDDLAGIMRQLARWYDVDVVISGKATAKRFSGSIRRKASFEQALQILKAVGVSSKQEGKLLTVWVN